MPRRDGLFLLPGHIGLSEYEVTLGAGLSAGYRFGRRLRVEAEWFHRESAVGRGERPEVSKCVRGRGDSFAFRGSVAPSDRCAQRRDRPGRCASAKLEPPSSCSPPSVAVVWAFSHPILQYNTVRR